MQILYGNCPYYLVIVQLIHEPAVHSGCTTHHNMTTVDNSNYRYLRICTTVDNRLVHVLTTIEVGIFPLFARPFPYLLDYFVCVGEGLAC